MNLTLGLAAAAALAIPAAAQPLRPYTVAGDAIGAPLTGKPGDPARGRAIVADRRVGLCLLCHTAPIPEERLQGDLAPGLAGAGERWTEGQLRLRIVDSRALNPATIMPSYYHIDDLHRVGRTWSGAPVLTAGQVEDVVAYLATLKETP